MLPTPAVDRLRTQLGQMPELIVLAHLALQPGSGRRGARVSGATRTAPLPCRLDVLSAIGPTAAAVHDQHGDQDPTPGLDLLASWARVVIADRQAANDWTGWFYPGSRMLHPLGWQEADVSLAVGYLLLHLDFAADRLYARDLADEISQLHRHLTGITGWTPAPPRPVRTVCPCCDLLTVGERTDGIRQCTNPACRAELTGDQHAALVDQRLAELAAA
ncbi:hypothetical protein [Kitasatospora sp. NPDC005748]|uniref:hypothetical protein n=1 Tax=Kitasatospora sp. NPDC005748 TaxID=3157063 RepID=UPI0033F6EFD8